MGQQLTDGVQDEGADTQHKVSVVWVNQADYDATTRQNMTTLSAMLYEDYVHTLLWPVTSVCAELDKVYFNANTLQ